MYFFQNRRTFSVSFRSQIKKKSVLYFICKNLALDLSATDIVYMGNILTFLPPNFHSQTIALLRVYISAKVLVLLILIIV